MDQYQYSGELTTAGFNFLLEETQVPMLLLCTGLCKGGEADTTQIRSIEAVEWGAA